MSDRTADARRFVERSGAQVGELARAATLASALEAFADGASWTWRGQNTAPYVQQGWMAGEGAPRKNTPTTFAEDRVEASLPRTYGELYPLGFERMAGNIMPSPPESISARHRAWSSNFDAIHNASMQLGYWALQKSGGDWRKSEALFNQYLSAADRRLARTGSPYALEWQPAAIANGERVPSFLWQHRGDETAPLVLNRDRTPRLYAYEGSRRPDAGLTNLTFAPNSYGLRPLVSAYDITLDAFKPSRVDYYRKYFGDIPIGDIRLLEED